MMELNGKIAGQVSPVTCSPLMSSRLLMIEDDDALAEMLGHRSSAKAIAELGYEPGTWADLEGDIVAAVQWYRELGVV